VQRTSKNAVGAKVVDATFFFLSPGQFYPPGAVVL
jgi:hypothetical protein